MYPPYMNECTVNRLSTRPPNRLRYHASAYYLLTNQETSPPCEQVSPLASPVAHL